MEKSNITDIAHKNHELLWPNYQSRIKENDPDFIALFDNFAFDDVINQDTLDTKTRVLMILASTLGSQALTEYKMYVTAALTVGISPIEIKEVLYQSVPYVGISKIVDFILATNEIFKDRAIVLPLPSQVTSTSETRYEEGLKLQKTIFGNLIDEMYQNSPLDVIHIQEFISANCFGDYYTRNGLDIATREMVTLSFLIAMGGTESQMKAHIKGNVTVGNDRKKLINLITQLLPYVGYPRTLNAIACLNEIAPE